MRDTPAENILLSCPIPIHTKVVYIVWFIVMLFLLKSNLWMLMIACMIFLAYVDLHLLNVVIVENGIEVHKIGRKRFIHWNSITRLETILGRAIIFTKGFMGFNVPRLTITNGRDNFHEAVKIIREHHSANH